MPRLLWIERATFSEKRSISPDEEEKEKKFSKKKKKSCVSIPSVRFVASLGTPPRDIRGLLDLERESAVFHANAIRNRSYRVREEDEME